MIKGLINWFQRTIDYIFPQNNQVQFQAQENIEAKKPLIKTNKTYYIDPTVPTFLLTQNMPSATALPLRGVGEGGGGFALGTAQQQADGLKQMVNDALVYMKSKCPVAITKWRATSTLTLHPRAGQDLNAYYDRSSLKFFYFPDNILKKRIYAADSRTVVTHEFGHAFLDILRPDFWSAQASEVWAYHEAFGDITAFLNNLQYDPLIQMALDETSGDLSKSNHLTRLAAEMGVGLHHYANGSYGELENCLRDMSIVFNYVIPETLPKDGLDTVLINESHSFSRVFSSMFYRLFVAIANDNVINRMAPIAAIKSARDTLASYLIQATIKAPLTPRLFKAICQEMLVVDQKNKSKYQKIMTNIFVISKIMPVTVKLLKEVKIESILKNITSDYTLEDDGDLKIIRVSMVKTMKISQKMGVLALNSNPLLDKEIETASQSAYYFDKDGNMIDANEASQSEIINAAYECLDIINKKNMASGDDKAIFEVVDDKIVRKQIVCTCNKPNYCIPGAPEYQKPWKPKNNSGCIACKSTCEPKSCDCEQPEPPAPPKIGCFTTINKQGATSYKFGQTISRKVC